MVTFNRKRMDYSLEIWSCELLGYLRQAAEMRLVLKCARLIEDAAICVTGSLSFPA